MGWISRAEYAGNRKSRLIPLPAPVNVEIRDSNATSNPLAGHQGYPTSLVQIPGRYHLQANKSFGFRFVDIASTHVWLPTHVGCLVCVPLVRSGYGLTLRS